MKHGVTSYKRTIYIQHTMICNTIVLTLHTTYTQQTAYELDAAKQRNNVLLIFTKVKGGKCKVQVLIMPLLQLMNMFV